MLRPHVVQRSGQGQRWDEVVTQLVVELLAHRTPPSAIAPNILSIVENLMPNATIIKELPSIRFIRNCRSILANVTQTLAAYEIAVADSIEQSYTDGTSRRQTAMQNFVVRIIRNGGETRRITLSSCIIATDETSQSIATAIMREFKHAGTLLTAWRETTMAMFPNNNELLNQIPDASKLSIAKLGLSSFTTTDTCNAARKLRQLLNENIGIIAIEEGWSEERVKTYEADCWHHLRNVWFGAVSRSLSEQMRDILADDLKEFPSLYRMDLSIDDLYRCIDKTFGQTANYAKGQGNEFGWFMKQHHEGA